MNTSRIKEKKRILKPLKKRTNLNLKSLKLSHGGFLIEVIMTYSKAMRRSFSGTVFFCLLVIFISYASTVLSQFYF